jgi:hypothetical protein
MNCFWVFSRWNMATSKPSPNRHADEMAGLQNLNLTGTVHGHAKKQPPGRAAARFLRQS